MAPIGTRGAVGGGGRGGLLGRALPLATARLPAARLSLPFRLVLCAHLQFPISARARHICYFLDYGALSLYSLDEPPGDGGLDSGCYGKGGEGGTHPGKGWGVPSEACTSGLSACPTPLRLRLSLCRLLHAGLLAAQPPAPVLCACRRTQFLPVHRPLLLLQVRSWPVLKGMIEGQNRAPTITLDTWDLWEACASVSETTLRATGPFIETDCVPEPVC